MATADSLRDSFGTESGERSADAGKLEAGIPFAGS